MMAPMALSEALLLTEKLAALAVLQQAAEQLWNRKQCSPEGVWSWEVLKPEFQIFSRPVALALGFLLRYPNFVWVLWIEVLAAASMLFVSSSLAPFILFASASLVVLRYRGTYNGGSDYMTLIILSGLTLARAWPEASQGVLFYIGIQSGLSYFVAGLVKIKEARWRSGEMLKSFMLQTNYNVSNRTIGFYRTQGREIVAGLSWLVIVFECLFPLAFINSQFAAVFLLGGFLFHLANVFTLGLNRFLFAWLASYPAIYFMAGSLGHLIN